MKKFITVLNYINLFSLLSFIPAKFNLFLLTVENGTLTEYICVNQTVITIIISLFIGIIGTIRKIPRPETGLAIITDSDKAIKIAVPFILVVCLAAYIILKLSPLYLLVCFMHAMSIFNSSRIIKKINNI